MAKLLSQPTFPTYLTYLTYLPNWFKTPGTEHSSHLQASRLEAVSSLASSLGISSLVLAALETAEHCQPQSPPQSPPPQHLPFPPQQLRLPKLPLDDSPVDMRQRRDDQEEIAAEEAASPPPTKRPRLTAAAVPMLHSLLSQLPLQPAAQQQQQVMLHSEDKGSEAAGGGIKTEEGEEEWGGGGESTWEQRLGMSGLGSLLQHPNHQLASLLTAAAKLKQVAEKAMRKSFSSLNFSALLCRLFDVFIIGSVIRIRTSD